MRGIGQVLEDRYAAAWTFDHGAPQHFARVRAFCNKRMADYKVPGVVVIRQEALPRNANGKIQKEDLRRMALDFFNGEQRS